MSPPKRSGGERDLPKSRRKTTRHLASTVPCAIAHRARQGPFSKRSGWGEVTMAWLVRITPPQYPTLMLQLGVTGLNSPHERCAR